MINVLFVCMGNICRSPMAEALFLHAVTQAGLSSQFTIDSAGTGGWYEGEAAHPGTLSILKQNKIAYTGRARQLIVADLGTFDYILAMDRQNLSHLLRLANSNKTQLLAKRPEITLFLSYANRADLTPVQEVPDPYYNDDFEGTYTLVKLGITALLDHIRAKHQL